MTMTCPLPGSVEDCWELRMKRGPCDGVKGAVDAYDPPLEARVPRLDRCCLKQKVGYSRDAAPKNNPLSKGIRRNRSCVAGCSAQYPSFLTGGFAVWQSFRASLAD